MPRGGRREAGPGKSMGRPKNPVREAGSLSKGMAQKLFQEAITLTKWRELREKGDHWFQLAVEKYIWDRAEGKPVQPMIQDMSPLEHLAEKIQQARQRVKQAR